MKINKERRDIVRKLHTTTHIVNYCARKVLGNHIWQNGSNIRDSFATLDITHYDNLKFEEMQQIENMANQIVFSGKKVVINELSREVAENKYGFNIYQGGAIPMKKIRIVEYITQDTSIQTAGGGTGMVIERVANGIALH